MSDFVNIIVPAIKVDDLLINCIYHSLQQTHTNYKITISIDNDDNIEKLYSLANKNKIEIDIIKISNVNISTKRNLAAYKSKSDFLAFIDSDAYPVKEWLSNSLNIFKEKSVEVVTGPTGLPFPDEKYFNTLINLCKRSFFTTGRWSKRKYSKNDFFLDQVESCNLIVKTKSFKKINGMNEKIYISEDTDFCNRINIFFGEKKMFYSGKCAIFHKDRNLRNFIVQRFSWGMYIDVDYSNLHGIDKLLIFLPLICFLVGTICSILSFWYINFLIFLLIIIIVFCCIVSIELSKFNINFFEKIICTFIIILTNISYSIGNLICLTKLQKLIGKKIYRNSKK